MMGLPGGRKSFKTGLAMLIQYRCVTSSHPASQPCCHSKYRAYYVTRVKQNTTRTYTKHEHFPLTAGSLVPSSSCLLNAELSLSNKTASLSKFDGDDNEVTRNTFLQRHCVSASHSDDALLNAMYQTTSRYS